MTKIKTKNLLFTLPLWLLAMGLWQCRAGSEALPNVVLIFIDDLGYGDLPAYGAIDVQTPHLDRLAREGMRFTNFYAAQAVCSASRAGLLTGCYPNRIGIWGALFPGSKVGISDQEVTIAEMLKTKGYATGIFGKWHLGHLPPFLPGRHGFDEYVGIPYSNDMWPVHYDGTPVTDPKDSRKHRYPPLPLIEGDSVIAEIRTLQDQDGLTTLLTERAVDFIGRHKDEPFFLYLPHPMVHVPLGVSGKFRGKSRQGMYNDVVMELDWSVGQIMSALERYGLDENTLVIFTSDNGPWLNFGNHAGSAGGLRQGKGTAWEGGQKVPCLMRLPGLIPAGSVCSELSATIDVLPTLAALAGAALPGQRIDGVDILPLLRGERDARPRETFLYYYNRNDLQAIRHQHWKLVFPHLARSYAPQPGNDGFPGPTVTDTVQLALFDLRRDPGEQYDVRETYPEVVAKLRQLAEEARQDLGDELTGKEGQNRRPCGREE